MKMTTDEYCTKNSPFTTNMEVHNHKLMEQEANKYFFPLDDVPRLNFDDPEAEKLISNEVEFFLLIYYDGL